MGKVVKASIKQIKVITSKLNKVARTGSEEVSEYEANKLDKVIDMLQKIGNNVSVADTRETRYR